MTQLIPNTQPFDLVSENTLIHGKRIAYGRHGVGEPVVLIHGTPSSSYIWRNVIPQLVTSGYRVHVFDLLGYGLSERPWDTAVDTSVSGQVPILRALLTHWGLERTHLVAHDIGGAIAQRFSIFHQAFVQSLTLIDTVSFDSWPSQRTREQMQAGLELLIQMPDQEHRAHMRDWLLSTVHYKEKIRESALEIFLEYISGPVGQGSFFQHQVRHYDHRHTSELNDRLSELGNLPVQILWGEQDAWQNVSWAHKLHAAIPGSVLQVLPDCGHFAMEDKPKEISMYIQSFLQKHTMS